MRLSAAVYSSPDVQIIRCDWPSAAVRHRCPHPQNRHPEDHRLCLNSQMISELLKNFYIAGLLSALDFNAIRKQFHFLKAEYDKLFAEVKTLEI